jgi:hypothetical protein
MNGIVISLKMYRNLYVQANVKYKKLLNSVLVFNVE